MSFDLTNKNIQDTFQNLLQKTGSEGHLHDLVGNKVRDLTIDGTLTANTYITSESITATSSGSTAFGNDDSDSHTFQGHITASGNISASGKIITQNAEFQRGVVFNNSGGTFVTQIKGNTDDNLFLTNVNPGGLDKIAIGGVTFPSKLSITGDLTTTTHITASGNISASGLSHTFGGDTEFRDDVNIGDDLTISDLHFVDVNSGVFRLGSGAPIKFNNERVEAIGDITASGDISSSGIIKGDSYQIKGESALGFVSPKGLLFSDGNISQIDIGKSGATTQTAIYGNITASGDISASGGTIEAGFYKVDGLSALNGINGNLQIGHTDHTNLSLQPAGVTTNHITASGNISGSLTSTLQVGGAVTGKMKHMFFHSGNWSSGVTLGGATTVYIPLNSTVESTTLGEQHQIIAPFNGTLLKIVFRALGGSNPGNMSAKFQKNGSVEVTESITGVTVGNNAVFSFSTNNAFNAGDVLALALNVTADTGDFIVTSVFQFDTNTIIS